MIPVFAVRLNVVVPATVVPVIPSTTARLVAGKTTRNIIMRIRTGHPFFVTVLFMFTPPHGLSFS
jgi:hypothetical protein